MTSTVLDQGRPHPATATPSPCIDNGDKTVAELPETDIEGDYLDYYATHRMTNDRHERIHSDGTCRALPCMGQFCMLSDDPEESERLQNEFDERNQQVSDMLNAKGFRNL